MIKFSTIYSLIQKLNNAYRQSNEEFDKLPALHFICTNGINSLFFFISSRCYAVNKRKKFIVICILKAIVYQSVIDANNVFLFHFISRHKSSNN